MTNTCPACGDPLLPSGYNIEVTIWKAIQSDTGIRLSIHPPAAIESYELHSGCIMGIAGPTFTITPYEILLRAIDDGPAVDEEE